MFTLIKYITNYVSMIDVCGYGYR